MSHSIGVKDVVDCACIATPIEVGGGIGDAAHDGGCPVCPKQDVMSIDVRMKNQVSEGDAYKGSGDGGRFRKPGLKTIVRINSR